MSHGQQQIREGERRREGMAEVGSNKLWILLYWSRFFRYLYFTWVFIFYFCSQHFYTNIGTLYSPSFQNWLITLVSMHLRGNTIYPLPNIKKQFQPKWIEIILHGKDDFLVFPSVHITHKSSANETDKSETWQRESEVQFALIRNRQKCPSEGSFFTFMLWIHFRACNYSFTGIKKLNQCFLRDFLHKYLCHCSTWV